MTNNSEAKVTFKVFNQEFNKALKEMQSESSKLRQEFNLQQEQLKLNGSETDKLKSKLDYLQRAQEIAAQKVAVTEAQLQKAKQVFGENSREVDKLSRDLLSAQTAEQRLANEIAQTNSKLSEQSTKAKETAESLNETSQKLKDIGGTATATVTPAIIGVGAGVTKVAADFDNAQGQIQAQLGLTAEEAEKLRDMAESVWKKGFGENIGEVTGYLAIVKQNIQDISDEALPKVTEQALILQKTFGAEVTESTRTASVMMKNFGIDASTAFDLMTVGFQKGGNFSDELLDTLREYSPQFATMGHAAEDMMNILISGAEAGAFNLDKVGDAVKEFNIRAKDGSKTTREGFQAIGLDAEKMGAAIAEGGKKGEQAFQATVAALSAIEDPVKRNQAGVALFGTQWEDLEADVISAMANSKNHVEGFEGSTARAGKALEETFGMKLASTLRDLQTALLPVGDVLLDFAESVLPTISSAAEKLANWFSKLSPIGQNLVILFGAIGIAIGPLLTLLGFMVQGIGALIGPITKAIGWLSKLGPAFTTIRTTLMAINPIFAIVSIAVTALAVLIYKNWDTIKAKTIEIWGAIKNWLSNTWKSIESVTKTVLNKIKTFISTTWNGIKTYFTTILAVYKTVFTTAWNGIKNVTNTVFNAIKSFISTVWNGIKTAISTVVNTIKHTVTNVWNAVQTSTSTVFNSIKGSITTIWNGIKSTFSTVIKSIKSTISSVWDSIKNTTSNVFNGIKSVIKSSINGAKSVLSSVVISMKNAVSTAWNAIKTKTSSIFNSLKSVITSPLKAINLLSIGQDIVRGLINGIKSKISDVTNACKDIASSVTSTVKKILGIHSPSRVMANEVGRWIPAGVSKGIDENIKSVIVSATKLAKAAVPRFSGEIAITKSELDKLNKVLLSVVKQVEKEITQIKLNSSKERKKIAEQEEKDIKEIKLKAKRDKEEIEDKAEQKINEIRLRAKDKKRKLTAAEEREIKEIKQKAKYDIQKLTENEENKINQIHKKAADNRAKITEDEKKKITDIQKQLNAEKFKALEDYVSKRKGLESMTTEQEVEFWKQATKEFKKGTEERIQAEINYKQAKEALDRETFEKEKSYIESRKELNKLSLVEELAMWEQVAKRYKEGSQERLEAEKNARNVRVQIYEELKSASDDYLAKVKEVNERVIQEEQRLNDAYTQAVDQRTQSLYSFASLFDEVTKKSEISGQQLIDNLKSQVDTFTEWSKNITSLASKGIDEGLLAELRAMGPSAAAEIAALNTLSDEQLQQYVTLWKDKNALAKAEATKELENLKIETDKKIKELHTNANNELELLKSDFIARINKIRTGTEGEFNVMTATLPQIGKNAIQGLIDGMKDMTGPLLEQAKQIADSVSQTLKSALEINNTSSLPSLGALAGAGAGAGTINTAAKISQQMASAVSQSISKSKSVGAGVGAVAGTKIEQKITINSPTPLSPAETARQSRLALQQAAFQLRR